MKPAVEPTALKQEDLKLPDGSLLDAKAVEDILVLANEKKLTKEAAQAILERESKSLSAYVEGEKARASQLQEKWYEDAKADKEIGGESYDKNCELGFRVIKRYGTPGLEKLFKDSGAHQHPEVMRFIVRIGQAMAPDQLVLPGAGSEGQALPRLADRLYSKPAEKKD